MLKYTKHFLIVFMAVSCYYSGQCGRKKMKLYSSYTYIMRKHVIMVKQTKSFSLNKTIKLKNSRSHVRYAIRVYKDRNTVLCFWFSAADVLSGFQAQHVYLPKSCYSNH